MLLVVFNPPMTGKQAIPASSGAARRSRRLAWAAMLAGLATGVSGWAVSPADSPAVEDAPDSNAVLVEEPVSGVAPQPAGPANPYLAVVTRNPFGLKEPPVPKPPEPEPEPEPEVEPSALKLSAISTLLSAKHAMFVLEEKGQKAVYSGLVAEGDTDPYIANLEVLAIDPTAGSVRVRYGGNELLLDFKNNGLKPPKGAAVVARAGTTAGRVNTTGRVVIPTVRTPTPRPGSTTWTAPGVNRGGVVPRSGSGSIPSRSLRSTTSSRNDGPVLSPAEQVLVMRAQKAEAESRGIPMPPSPPVPGIDMPPGLGGGNLPPNFPPQPGQ